MGCGDDADPPTGMEDGTETGTTGDTTPTPPGTTGDTTPTPDPDSTTTDDPMDTDTDSDTDTEGGNEFQFDDSPPEDYAQVDRMGMPAINTAVITDKDLYNLSSPADDITGVFVPEIIDNLTGLHAALDDDLMGLGLVPCVPDMSCVDQAGPLVVPDTITIDLTAPAGFPNGRLPADPVMDVTLAVVLLDLNVMGQDALTLVGVNPTANDVEFLGDFPYFAAPH